MTCRVPDLASAAGDLLAGNFCGGKRYVFGRDDLCCALQVSVIDMNPVATPAYHSLIWHIKLHAQLSADDVHKLDA